MLRNKGVLKTVGQLFDTQRQNLQKRESKLNAFVITMSSNFILIRELKEVPFIFLTTTLLSHEQIQVTAGETASLVQRWTLRLVNLFST